MANTPKKTSGKGTIVAAIVAAVVGAAATFLSRKDNRDAVADKAGKIKGKAEKVLKDMQHTAVDVQKEGKKAVDSIKHISEDLQKSAEKVKKVASKESEHMASSIKKNVEKARS